MHPLLYPRRGILRKHVIFRPGWHRGTVTESEPAALGSTALGRLQCTDVRYIRYIDKRLLLRLQLLYSRSSGLWAACALLRLYGLELIWDLRLLFTI